MLLVSLQFLLTISSPILSAAIPTKDFYSFGVNETDRNLPRGDSEEERLTILTSFPFFGKSHTTLYVSGLMRYHSYFKQTMGKTMLVPVH